MMHNLAIRQCLRASPDRHTKRRTYRVFTRSSKRPALHLLEVCWIV